MTFKGYIQNGKIKYFAESVYHNFIKKYEGDKIAVTIEKEYAKRSNAQNAYYWSVVVKMASDHTGYTKDEIHDFHKDNFLSDGELIEIGGKTSLRRKTTKKMKTIEFSKWIEEKLIPFWAEQDVFIPLPNEAPFY